MRKLNLKIAALPVMALIGVAPAWGQANPKQSTTCFAQGQDENGNPTQDPLMCAITVVGNLETSKAERSEAIDQIEPNSGQRIENALRTSSSLQQFRRSDARSANPTSQGITLRGLGGNASSRAALFVDNVPQADPFGGWISWPGYDALNLASTRVRRGAGQPAAGPGALAGVIELDSRQWPPQKNARVAYGSRNSLDAKASGLFGVNDGHISVAASYARGDGFIPVIESQRGTVDRGAEYEQAGLALRAVASLADEVELQANLRGFIDERDRGFDFSNNENSGADASLRIVDRYGDWQWSALGYVQLRDFSTRFGSVAADRNSVRLVLDQFSVPSTGLGTRFELRPPLGDDWELRLGGDWRRTIGETRENFFFIGPTPQRNRNAGGRTDTFGGFAELSWQPARSDLTLTAGGRVDRWNIADGFRREINLSDGSIRSDDVFSDRSGAKWTARVGGAYQASDDIKFRAAAYSGWRLPTLNELYRPFRVGADATAANELLSPERVRGTEIGAEYESVDEDVVSVTAFWNRLDDAIANVTLDSGPGLFPGVGFVSGAGVFRQRQNLGAIDSKGVEIDLIFDLTDEFGMNSGYENFQLRAGYAFVDAEVESGGTAVALDGLRPAQVPKHTATVALDYDDRIGLKAGLQMRYIGNQFEDEGNTRLLDDAFSVDAWLGHDLTGLEKWIIEARVENLFNAEVQAGISGSGIIERATPRTLWLGLRLKL